MAATIALEMIGPMPGTLINRSQPASWRAMVSISFDKPSRRLLLTVILAVFLGCHAYVAFIVLPVAHPDWQKSDPTPIGVQD
jgi:hypothetical protein